VEAVAGDVAVVQDKRDLWIGGELRESAGFVGWRDGERGDAEVSEVAQRSGPGGTGEGVGVGWYGVVAIEDKEMAGDRLRDRRFSVVLRLRERGVNQRRGSKGKSSDEKEAAKHGK
jgi:hypothetical protein